MSLVDDTCDNCGGRFDPMGDPLLTKHPEIGPYAVFCATCETSVPPAQPPAAPESDVRLTEAERAVIESWLRLGDDHPLAGSIADRELFATVERIVADRVRVVEGERDAALAEAAEMSGWIEEHALVTTLARIAEWQEATGAELPAMARAAMTAYAARAESAEAAHEALRKGIEALADEYAENGAQREAAGRPAWPNNVARDLRALLASEAR